jgi:hypothetical protein
MAPSNPAVPRTLTWISTGYTLKHNPSDRRHLAAAVLLETKLMAIHFSKGTVLTLYCYCRQAERSLDNALSSPRVWSQLLAYYHANKQTEIRKLLSELKWTGPNLHHVPKRGSFALDGFRAFASSLANLLINRMKKSWAFSEAETAFIAGTLAQLLGMLQNSKPPKTEDAIDLRLDFLECEFIIAHKLIGVPELRTAINIEHFNQASHITHVTFHDMGVHGY